MPKAHQIDKNETKIKSETHNIIKLNWYKNKT